MKYTTRVRIHGTPQNRQTVARITILSDNLSKHTSLEEIIKNVKNATIIAGNRIMNRQTQYAKQVDALRRHISLDIGDEVLVRKYIKKTGLSSKLLHYYYGPYTIIEKPSVVNYIIEYRNKKNVHRETVHVEKLKLCHERNDDNNTIDVVYEAPIDYMQLPAVTNKSPVTLESSSHNSSSTQQINNCNHTENTTYNLGQRKSFNYKI